MSQRLDPKLEILPAAQREIWRRLMAAPDLGLVLYGGTAIALHLGHCESKLTETPCEMLAIKSISCRSCR